jgi:hypothetical protein
MSAPLQPITYNDLDQQINSAASMVLEAAGLVTSVANWMTQVVTQANADNGLLLGPDSTALPGGGVTSGYAKMTAEQVAYYQDIAGKLTYIAGLWGSDQGSNPSAVVIVRPWTRSGTGVQVSPVVGVPAVGVRRY